MSRPGPVETHMRDHSCSHMPFRFRSLHCLLLTIGKIVQFHMAEQFVYHLIDLCRFGAQLPFGISLIIRFNFYSHPACGDIFVTFSQPQSGPAKQLRAPVCDHPIEGIRRP